jgi:tRNA (Thr-GGU) A37 N-methylase
MDEGIRVRPIGYVRSEVEHQTDEAWGQLTSRIELDEESRGGCLDLPTLLARSSSAGFHQARFDARTCLVRRPRGLASMPAVRIFSQRAKDRPNPIGVTAVPIVRVDAGAIEVGGLDAIDCTPVLDLKPYYPACDPVRDAVVPPWVDRLMDGYF